MVSAKATPYQAASISTAEAKPGAHHVGGGATASPDVLILVILALVVIGVTSYLSQSLAVRAPRQ